MERATSNPRHGALLAHRLRELSPRSDVFRLQAPYPRRARQPEATGIGRRRRESIPVSDPSLRNLKYTAPYMHSGMIPTLDDVIEFYDDVNGGRRGRAGRTRNPQVARADLDPLLRRLNVNGGRRRM